MHRQDPPADDCYIQYVAGLCRSSAADFLPLALWMDIIFDGSRCVTCLSGKEEAELPGIARSRVPTGPEFMWRHCDFLSVYIVRQGHGTHIIEGIPYGVARGDVFTMGIGMAHYFSQCDYLELDTLHFSPKIFDAPVLSALRETPGFQSLFFGESYGQSSGSGRSGRRFHLTPDAYIRVTEMVAELQAEWLSETPVGDALTRGLLLRLLVHLSRLYARDQAVRHREPVHMHARGEAAVAAAVGYMDEHYAEPIAIDQVAAHVFLSPDRFREVFAAVMGCTPRDYLRYLRLEHAKTLLGSTDQSITDIAQQTGFGEVTYFNRVFREMTGMTPSAYRRRVSSGAYSSDPA